MPDNRFRGLRGLKVVKSVSDLAQQYGRDATPEEKKIDEAADAKARLIKGVTPPAKQRRRKSKAAPKKSRKVSKKKAAPKPKAKKAAPKKAAPKKTRSKKAAPKPKKRSKPKPKSVDDSWNTKELYEYAQILEVPNRSTLSKTQMIRAINRALKKK
jgi:hypothetical protein